MRLIDLDLRYVTEEDFKIILKLDELNDNGEKDDMLVYLVKQSLRVNNYILSFLEMGWKIRNKNNDEQIILDLVKSVSNFSFRTTEKYYEIAKNKVGPENLTLTPPNNNISVNINMDINCENNNDLEIGGIVDLNFLTTKEIKCLHFAKKLRKFLKEYSSRSINLTSNDQAAIDGKKSLHLLDLCFVPKDDFFIIRDLERENLKKKLISF